MASVGVPLAATSPLMIEDDSQALGRLLGVYQKSFHLDLQLDFLETMDKRCLASTEKVTRVHLDVLPALLVTDGCRRVFDGWFWGREGE